MSDTIIDMDYIPVDILNASQLEVDDLIGLGDEVVKIISIHEEDIGFTAEIENEFGERDMIEIGDDEKFELFIWD